MLHVPGAGLDGIDLASLSPGCVVCNVFEHEAPIAEFVLLAMLEWQVRLTQMRGRFSADSLVRRLSPSRTPWRAAGRDAGPDRLRPHRPRDRHPGQGPSACASWRSTRRATDPAGLADEVLPPAELPRLLAEADFVVIACPLTEGTRGLLDARDLAAMKR